MVLLRLLQLLLLTLSANTYVVADTTILPLFFEPLPLGSIKPQGWLRETMEAMRDGLPGHQFDFYIYVRNSTWFGGQHEYSDLTESAPYWFNSIVPLAYGLDDERLKSQVRQFVGYVIEHQEEDGWLGGTVGRRDLWARFPFILGLTQLLEAAPDYAETVVPALYRFFTLMNSMLRDHQKGYTYWGRARSQDMILSLQWMYENYPEHNRDMLLDNMRLLHEDGYDWSYFFREDVFPKQDLDSLPKVGKFQAFEHVVNLGQGLKSGAIIRRFTHNDTLLERTRNAVNWTFTYYGAPSGAIIGDERISGTSPMRGSELCGVVETIFSLSYLYQSLGDWTFADKCELTAFNALPVMVSPDWWSHQYVAQANQPFSRPLKKNPFWNVSNRGQIFGLEPHFPCCTTNHPQGFPKFLTASFVKVGSNGLGHSLLSPGQVTTSLNGDNIIAVSCETNYPLELLLHYTIDAQRPFEFHVRVPQWYIAEGSYILKSNGKKQTLKPDPHTGMSKIAIGAGTTTIRYQLMAGLRVEHRANHAISIYYGSILYALQIGKKISENPPHSWANQRPLPNTYIVPQAHDYTITNTTAWAVAIDPSTLQVHFRSPEYSSNRSSISQSDSSDSLPIFITAQGCEIPWKYSKGVAAEPPPPDMRRCIGKPFEANFIPYGTAKIHMSELPTIDLSYGQRRTPSDQIPFAA